MKMRKRVCSALLALVLTLSAAVLPASAAESFSDVSDKETMRNAEVLRLLGVMEGDGTGRFDPNGALTRAQFCKMVVVLMGKGEDAVRYQTVTIFPDVRASHWAAGYINLAVRQSEPKLLAGQPDGTFAPDRAISYGEAVTILMRLLGYTDADSGGVWPDGYINLAKSTGVSAGVTLAGSATITRAQAARLFVNLLSTGKDGKGYTPALYTRSGEVTLLSMNGSTVRVREDGKTKTYDLVRPGSSSALNGYSGYLLFDRDGKAVTFVPKKSSASTSAFASSAAVIVASNGAATGISALTEGRTDYTVYRNGVLSSISALRKNDVVTYNAANNTLYACDTRVTVYYENCEPSPAEPVSITVLDGTQFDVLPSAQQSLSAFKPGKIMTLLLTVDGQVAGAVSNDSSVRGNALGIVSGGTVELLVGGTTVELNVKADAELEGKLVSLSSSAKGKVELYAKTGGVSGDLNVRERTLGGKTLADGAVIYDDGQLITLGELNESVVPERRIAYARTNAAGEVDLIVMNNSQTEYYGRIVFSSRLIPDENGRNPKDPGYNETIKREYYLDCNAKKYDKEDIAGYSVSSGDFVSTNISKNQDGTDHYYNMMRLTKLEKVSPSSWIGTTAVNHGGRTYTVPADVLCWNADAGDWITGDNSIEAALAYGGTMNLYVKDGVVRALEVKG